MTLAPQGRTELLVSGGGCACCAVDSSAPATATDASAAPFSATFGVEGMTCSNCVRHVTRDVGALAGVDAVDVELVAGGVSTVVVRGAAVIDADAVAKAVADAGYEVVARS